MTAATKTRARHLRVVTDHAPAPVPDRSVRAATTLAKQGAHLAEQHDQACMAALAPDVVEQQHAAVAKALAAIATPGANLHAILDQLCRRMYVTGHMDGAADSRQDAPAELTLASITALDTRREAGR